MPYREYLPFQDFSRGKEIGIELLIAIWSEEAVVGDRHFWRVARPQMEIAFTIKDGSREQHILLCPFYTWQNRGIKSLAKLSFI